MALESGNWIKDLQPLNPPGTDPVSVKATITSS